LDPQPRARSVSAFHRPEWLRDWLEDAGLKKLGVAEKPPAYRPEGSSFLAR
jgi:hypothetical protein